MSAKISSTPFIKRTGVTVENEPIIKSDGAGEMMQWQPSDGAADGVYMVEGGSAGDPIRLGVGVAAPVRQLQIHNPNGTGSYAAITDNTSEADADDGLLVGQSGLNS